MVFYFVESLLFASFLPKNVSVKVQSVSCQLKIAIKSIKKYILLAIMAAIMRKKY